MDDPQTLIRSDMLKQHAAVPSVWKHELHTQMNINTHTHTIHNHTRTLSPDELATDETLNKIKYYIKTQGGEGVFFQQAL